VRNLSTMPRVFDIPWKRKKFSCVLDLSLQDEPISTSLKDRSGNGNDGIIINESWTKLSNGLWCLSLNGTDSYVYCADSSSLDITNNISIEVWLKFNDTPAVGAAWSISEKGGRGGGTNNWALYTENNNTTLRFGAGFGGVWVSYGAIGTQLGIGEWRHVVITYDGTNIRSYLDSVMDLNELESGVLSTNDTALNICGNSDYVNGFLGAHRIYTQALTQEEVTYLYRSGRRFFASE